MFKSHKKNYEISRTRVIKKKYYIMLNIVDKKQISLR